MTMLDTRRKELEQMLDAAEAGGDPAKVKAVERTMNREYRECTSHTAERLKRVEDRVGEIADFVAEIRSWKKIALGLYTAATVIGPVIWWGVTKFIGL